MKTLNLSEFLSPERCHCSATTKSSRKVFELISETFCNGILDDSANKIFQCFLNREQLGTTTIGNGIAIPHCRSQFTDSLKGCLITLSEGVDLQAHDGKDIDIFFGIIAPEEVSEAHSDILIELSEIFSDPSFCQDLRACKTDAELHQTFLSHGIKKAVAS